MKHFIGGFAFGMVFVEIVLVAARATGLKEPTTLAVNFYWGIFLGLAAWGLLP